MTVLLNIEVAYSAAAAQCEVAALQVPEGSTVADALKASGLPAAQGWDLSTLRVGLWGKLKPLDTVLRERDRLEVYRPLQVDPKEARRARYAQHKASEAERAARQAARKAGTVVQRS